MIIGMWTAKENRERLERVEERLRDSRLRPDERAELEEFKRELQAWFRDLERLEG